MPPTGAAQLYTPPAGAIKRGGVGTVLSEIVADTKERVYLRSGFGGSRVVSVPEGFHLPRIG